IHVRDLDGRFIMINPAAARLYGKDAQELLGTHVRLRDAFPTEVATVIEQHTQNVLDTLKPATFEETIPIQGVQRTFLTGKYPLLDQGRPYAVCTIATDITTQKESEIALNRAKVAAEQASQFKD